MIAEFGLALLWLAAALAGLQTIIAFGAVYKSDPALIAPVRPVAVAQGVLTAASFVVLIWLFIQSDMSVELVATNSHSDKPMLYKVAGTWGNHEGSMLLWVTVMAISGAAIALFERRLGRETHVATLGAQALISLGFYAFLLFSSNPFARLDPAPADGQGLNPLLQDPGLAFHPPTLYLGYVGLSVAFAFAVGALLTRRVDADFAIAMRPWVLGSWVFLTLGIVAGSYWAYYELGWGGWWFWDPVENASLMPWLAATALLHSVTVLASRDALRAWTIMLAVIAFSMSMVGTFLVRSGILTSVHAFAVDPERGNFILVLMALAIGGALALFALRIGTVREGATFEPTSRETFLVINNVLLSVILGLVLVGTLYPLLTEAFGVQVSVGPPYFNRIIGPIALLMAIAMAVGPMVRWRRDTGARISRASLVPFAAAIIVGVGVAVQFWGEISVLSYLGIVAAVGLAAGSVMPLSQRRITRVPLATWGMVVAHLGMAVCLFGMAVDSAFTRERLAAARPGDTIEDAGWVLEFVGVKPVAGANWTAMQGEFKVRRGNGPIEVIGPQARFFTSPPTPTTEAALLNRWDGQLFVVLGDQVEGGRWQVRVWWKPFVTLIWYGGIMIALGGALAIVGRLRVDRKRTLARATLSEASA